MPRLDTLYVLVHFNYGPIRNFTTAEEAIEELRAILEVEPGWDGHFTIDRFTFTVAEPRSAV